MPFKSAIIDMQPADSETVRPALRWLLILATALLLFHPGRMRQDLLLDSILIAGFAASNLLFWRYLKARREASHFDHVVVIADTFLVAAALYRAGLENSGLPLVFFVVLFLAAIGPSLPRLIVGVTLVSGLYIYLAAGSSFASALDGVTLLLRVPFLFVVALYYGQLVSQVREQQEVARRLEREKRDLEAFVEITSTVNSTLDLHQILYLIVSRIASLVDALRCSILTVDEDRGEGLILASSDDASVRDLKIDLQKYPEVRRVMVTHEAMVINDVAREEVVKDVAAKIEDAGFRSILILPLMARRDLLGMLILRAARRRSCFTPEEIAACQIVANASANAVANATLFEQMRSEVRVRKEALHKLQNIMDHFPDLIYTTDMEGRLTEFSRGGTSMLGYSRAEALALTCADLYPEPAARERMHALLHEGIPLHNFETTVRGRDGLVRDVLVATAVLKDDTGVPSGTVGIIKNVTDLKAARTNLIQAEKLSALGEVVSGVAHELNNPLAGVLGYAQLLMSGPMESRQQRSVERIFESALRCQKIVQNLLAFARRYPSAKRYLGLNGIIEKTLDLKAYQLRVNNLQVVKRLEQGLPKTMLDFNQIQQVLLNIINNAQYAITSDRGQGTLTVSTRVEDGRIQLRVADDGPGIAPEILGRIFDPFFTTKPVGEGSGLGLSVSYGIVRDHGGRIWGESVAPRGTAVFVELPIVAAEDGDSAARGGDDVAGRKESDRILRILAVDDEPVILDLIVDALSRDRHSVVTASNAREALTKIEQGSYDVLLIDLKMPEMDGHQLFDVIRARWPEKARRVVFASGDVLHPDTGRFIEQSGRPCVDKPFRLETLIGVILEVARGADSDEVVAATGG